MSLKEYKDKQYLSKNTIVIPKVKSKLIKAKQLAYNLKKNNKMRLLHPLN